MSRVHGCTGATYSGTENQKAIRIVESHGAECAFPTSTVYIPNGVSVEQ